MKYVFQLFLYALNIDICTNGYYGMIVPGNWYLYNFSFSSYVTLRNCLSCNYDDTKKYIENTSLLTLRLKTIYKRFIGAQILSLYFIDTGRMQKNSHVIIIALLEERGCLLCKTSIDRQISS